MVLETNLVLDTVLIGLIISLVILFCLVSVIPNNKEYNYKIVGKKAMIYTNMDTGVETEYVVTLLEDKEHQERTYYPFTLYKPINLWKQYKISTEQLIKDFNVVPCSSESEVK